MRRFYWTVLFLAAFCGLSAEDYSYGRRDLEGLFRDRPLCSVRLAPEGPMGRGVSLLEALPLMEEVYRMELGTSSGSIILEDEDLAESWSDSYLLGDPRRLDLLLGGILYHDVSTIRFQGTPVDSDSLEVWLSWEGVDELKAELESFASDHGFEVKALEVPSPDSKLVSVVRARGDVPDLVMIQSSAVDRLTRERAVQNLDYLQLPGIGEAGKDAFSLNGRLAAVPFYYDTQVFLYNPEILERPPGPDWTLADLERAAERARRAGFVPMAWNAYSSNWLIPFQMSFGKDSLLDADGSITVDDDANRRALSYVLGLVESGRLVPMERDAMDARFINGEIAVIMTGSYSIPYFRELGIPFEVLGFPVNQATGRSLSPLLDYKGFCMTRRTRSPILARRVLQFLAGAGIQQRFSRDLAKLPAREGTEDPGEITAERALLLASSRNGTVIPTEQVYDLYKNTMWKLLRFALSGQMSVGDTLEQGQVLLDNAVAAQ